MSDYHAIASPSSAEKWLTCANSLAAELGQPDTAGAAADLGTDKHALLTDCLRFGEHASGLSRPNYGQRPYGSRRIRCRCAERSR